MPSVTTMEAVLSTATAGTSTYVWIGIVAGLVGVLVTLLALMFKFGDWHGKVNSDRSSFKEFMKEVRDDIKEILQRLPNPPLSASSPLRLTDFGEKIAHNISAGEWADQIVEEVSKEVIGKSPYEIQEFCFTHVQSLKVSPDQKLLLDNCAYEHGIDVETVLKVLGVVVRDKLLGQTEQHASD